MAGAVAAGTLLVHRRLGLVAAGLAVLMALTRVYVGAHWPLDVVAGLVVGAVVSVASHLLLRPALRHLVPSDLRCRHTAAMTITVVLPGPG